MTSVPHSIQQFKKKQETPLPQILSHTFCRFKTSISFICFLNAAISSDFCFSSCRFSNTKRSIFCFSNLPDSWDIYEERRLGRRGEGEVGPREGVGNREGKTPWRYHTSLGYTPGYVPHSHPPPPPPPPPKGVL